MEEIEVPTEHLQETIKEKIEEAEKEEKEKESKWSMYVAISTALVAVFAAIAALMAGHHSNEALIEQIKSSDQWAFYQAKGIKAEIKNITNDAESKATAERYKKEQEEIKQKAEEAQTLSEAHLAHHVLLARSVTLFQISIAVSAIAILTRKKIMWYAGLLFAITGIVFFASGLF
ncbi:MAG: DUF4337 domain-containing protein [Sphingobacteriales bacterium]|nr:MAG: DUF4337 domain-containing protein [Sphingobacteriales bacterium]